MMKRPDSQRKIPFIPTRDLRAAIFHSLSISLSYFFTERRYFFSHYFARKLGIFFFALRDGAEMAGFAFLWLPLSLSLSIDSTSDYQMRSRTFKAAEEDELIFQSEMNSSASFFSI